ncbi:ANAC083 transcription factor [Musa troglodytarum]|uniref:ANAC083 transcription factor n=1 Tax=Musa troglodytarum TaxID=320322 RepID=A0A9E7GHW9_9LILI|nr:ANAC083 transcription factor [Musa troglodytarum]
MELGSDLELGEKGRPPCCSYCLLSRFAHMESKPSFLRHGVLRLPPGFRFHPTDEELVVQYLRRKVFSCPLPASIIPEINLAKLDPWDLPGGCEEERYCFNLREAKYRNGSWSNRAARSGYWKATRKDKQITSPSCGQVVGLKKVLVFHRGKPPAGTKTDWVMHEYRLAGTESTACIFPQRHNSTHRSAAPSGDWVLCRIFKKKRATKMDVETDKGDELPVTNSGIGFIDFMGQRDRDQNHSSSSSESSCITELSDGSSNGEETGSRSSIPRGSEA